MEDVIPAESRPIDIKYLEKSPRNGDNCFPMSTAFFTSFPSINPLAPADVIIIAVEIIPPINIEKHVSIIDDLYSFLDFHFFLPRKSGEKDCREPQ